MTLLATGGFLWLAALTTLTRLLFLGANHKPSRQHVLLWAVAITAAGILLFRPHEDFLGGQDQGAYLNAAATYARTGALSYTDPLLAQVPPEDRTDFLYGDDAFPDTKTMTFHVPDLDSARIETYFQPAYPILMSVVARLLSTHLMLYVTPLFTLLTAIALWVLAGRLFPNTTASAAAFMLYLLNPITAWHGRSARPEPIASFFIIAGCALLIHAVRRQNRAGWLDAALAALCLALAPFFHITAWLTAIPAAIVVGALLLKGHMRLLPYPGIAALGLGLFAFQSRYVTDCYGLNSALNFLTEQPVVWAGAILFGLTVLTGVSGAARFRERYLVELEGRSREASAWFHALLFLAVAVCAAVLFAWLHRAGRQELILFKSSDGSRLVQLTEMAAVVLAVSKPAALAALAGWILLLARPGSTQACRVLIALGALPALLLAGDMPVLMYFLRRALTFIVPMIVLSLSALVAFIAANGGGRARRIAAWLVIALLIAAGCRGRTELYRTRDYQGLLDYLQPFAEEINTHDGILLAEYSRLAAPLEHVFGVPTLSLDNESIPDYSCAMAAWDAIVRRAPARAAYFLTPFGLPVTQWFAFTPVMTGDFEMRLLQTEHNRLPSHIRRPPLRMTLYRMTPRSVPRPETTTESLPFIRPLDKSNVGLTGFSRGRERTWAVHGIPLRPGETVEVVVPEKRQGLPMRELLLFFYSAHEHATAPHLQSNGRPASNAPWTALLKGWYVLRAPLGPDGLPPAFSLTSRDPLLLVGANALDDNRMFVLPLSNKTATAEIPITSRWARSRSDISVPVPAAGEGVLLLLVNPSRPPEIHKTALRVSTAGPDHYKWAHELTSEWHWQAYSVPPADAGGPVRWINIKATPPWNPRRGDYPKDLGILVAGMVVLPPLEAAAQPDTHQPMAQQD